MKQTLTTWLPLVASWMLMAAELPGINAIIARLPQAEVHLAAYGGVVFPIALVIESPIIMLLAASTAFSRDWASYQRLKKITLWMGISLSALHLLVAITPLYDFIVLTLLRAPEAVIEPGRASLLFLTPWTFAIAYRRFQQGAMIRFDNSRMVSETTAVRLTTDVVVLAIGYSIGSIPGATLAAIAQGVSVSVEALYAELRIRKIRHLIKTATPIETPLTLKRFIVFYSPLALTSILWYLWQPLVSGTISRMPFPLESLAVWAVTSGLISIIRTPGVAFNETTVALLERPCAFTMLRKFTRIVALIIAAMASLFVFTPLSRFWFSTVANLPADLTETARTTLAIALAVSIFSVYNHFFQGIILQQEHTRPVAESTIVFLLTLALTLIIGVVTSVFKGVFVVAAGYTLAHLTQGLWLMIRSHKQRKLLSHCETN
ncbi:MAG: hypothetical protein GX142_05545 [Chloroflexi bacterium]|nr:hypothetical protein [Chloroflexota bacterium]